MSNAMGISALGLINDMLQMDVISHNLANANTAGYKRQMTLVRSFDAELSQATGLSAANGFQSQANELVPNVRHVVDPSPGALNFTGNPLDVAIEGDAFFELADSAGVRYSRHGAFMVDRAGRLVNGEGLTVRGEEGEILLHGGEVTIDPQGKVHEDGDYAGQLKLVKFRDPTSLIRDGGGMWRAPTGMTAESAEHTGVRQGYVEASNVKAMEEMVRMITVLRHFETSANVIKGYDEMLGTAISTIAEF